MLTVSLPILTNLCLLFFWYIKISPRHPQLSKRILLTVLIIKDSIKAKK